MIAGIGVCAPQKLHTVLSTYRKYLIPLLLLLWVNTSWAQQWTVLGPHGGDVRSLSYDPGNPDRIYLGTGSGTMFISTDGGHTWSRFAHLGNGDDYVLDHIVIDAQNPNNIFVPAWSVEDQKTGDLFRSQDGGSSWEALPAMHGVSVRALAMAASDPKMLVVGALDGVHRTLDGGNTWERISPFAHSEIKNIESIAVDPKDPNVIYAGTWHLAWKTDDGGKTWHRINRGMIDDSDVFSIVVDSSNPSVVFASACSGIYKSDTAGEMFHKIVGMPFSARRTRVLKQDPGNPEIVYAGTTEGLWKTADAGKNWKRVSNSEMVVNDVLIDPRHSERVLVATDRSGVMASNDGARTFLPSNQGYTHRYVAAILADENNPNTILVGVVNDRDWGGVFSSSDGGEHWQQKSAGLGGRDVLSLSQAKNGALVAGTSRGIFMLDRNASSWRPINTITYDKAFRGAVKPKTKKTTRATGPPVNSTPEPKVNEIEITPKRWLAATSAGLFSSSDGGKSWSGGPVLGRNDFVAVRSQDELEVVATRTNVLVSSDGGRNWHEAGLPPYVNGIRGVTVTPDRQILIASVEGGFRGPGAGGTWEQMRNGLPDRDISSIYNDEANNRLLATGMKTSVVFVSGDGGRTWRPESDSGYPMRRVIVVGERVLAVTPFDGVIAEPERATKNAPGESVSALDPF